MSAEDGPQLDQTRTAGIGEGIKLLLPFARDGRKGFVAAAILAIVSTVCRLAVFYVVYRAARVAVGIDDFDSARLYGLAVWAFGLVVVDHVTLAFSLYISHKSAYATLEKLRLRIGDRLGRVPLGFLTNRRTGEIQRTLSDDVERLELFLAHALPDTVAAVSVLSITTVWLFVVDWRLGLATILAVVVSFPVMAAGMRSSAAKMNEYHQSMSRMNGSVVEFLNGMPVIRVFNRGGETLAEVREAVRGAAQFQAQWGREVLPTFSLFYVLLATNAVVLVPVGIWLWQIDAVEAHTLLFFFVFGLGYSAPILKLMEFFASLSHLTFGAHSILELDHADGLVDATVPVEIGAPLLDVRNLDFSHLAFDGSKRQVLADISFSAAPGTVTALVGASGSGKTTLAKLLCRFWDPDAGAISLGGHDVRQVPFDQLMEQISFVFQEAFLFDDTVANNVRLGRVDASDEEVIAAAKAARAHGFVQHLPNGYETRIGEGGARLSGGEKQRLTIARSFLKGAPLVVLDEATAFSDPENEAAIQDGIGALIAGRTVIMIAHRLSTIIGADQILVLDAPNGEPGRIVERGTHAELLEQDGYYGRMWKAAEPDEVVSLGDAVRSTDAAVTGALRGDVSSDI